MQVQAVPEGRHWVAGGDFPRGQGGGLPSFEREAIVFFKHLPGGKLPLQLREFLLFQYNNGNNFLSDLSLGGN